MKKQKKLYRLLLLMIMVCSMFVIGNKQVQAAVNCKVVFANSDGVVTEALEKYARIVPVNTVIKLPNIAKEGYKAYWVEKTATGTVKYEPGAKVQVSRSVKLYLVLKKLYKVSFYSRTGAKEYVKLSVEVTKGTKIKLPAVNSSEAWKVTGWSTKKNQTNGELAFGKVVAVKGNANLYLAAIPERTINLYWNDGRLYKQLVVSKTEKAYFPEVSSRIGGNIIGWSTQKGKHTKPDYYPNGAIPAGGKKFYMVEFRPQDDLEVPVKQLISPTKYQHIYFVGDSRTERAQPFIESYVKHVTYVGKSGMGLAWLRGDADCPYTPGGYKRLLSQIKKDVKKGEKGRKAVIFNLGANDLVNYQGYIDYMNKISATLKKYKCDLYFMSVNPVNMADYASLKGAVAKKYSNKKIVKFNKYLKKGLNSNFKYIDTHSYLMKNGWISSSYGTDNIRDGLHYTKATYQRLYNVAVRYVENCY